MLRMQRYKKKLRFTNFWNKKAHKKARSKISYWLLPYKKLVFCLGKICWLPSAQIFLSIAPKRREIHDYEMFLHFQDHIISRYHQYAFSLSPICLFTDREKACCYEVVPQRRRSSTSETTRDNLSRSLGQLYV